MHVAVEAVRALLAESLVGGEHLCAERVVDSTSQADSTHSCLANDFLERAESVVERTLTATAGQSEVALQRPSALVVGILERRDNGSESLTLEIAWSSGVVHVVGEQLVVVLDCTCLVCHLPVDSEVASFAHKHNAGRVVIHTINTNRSLAAHHTIKSDVLVGVCEKTTGESRTA